jgi:hypothetical protein
MQTNLPNAACSLESDSEPEILDVPPIELELEPEPAAEEPAVEGPATEEPAVEEPATEEPATEEPATEEPATEEPATEEPTAEEPTAEEPAAEEPASERPLESPRAFGYGWSYSQTHHRSRASRKANLRRSFDTKFICSTLPRQRIINSCEIIPNSHVKQDYTGVFLAHARLYVLADKYGIEPLESLSLHKLHATLKRFTLHRARIGDILKLARYAYENGSDYESNKLRALVSEYIACEIDTIGKRTGSGQ